MTSAPRHRVWADVDLSALRRNLDRVGDRLEPGGRVLAVVKADAYGHGAVPVARALAGHARLWGFGVGDSNEALELRAAGVTEPVLVLGTIIDEETPQVVSHDVRVGIHSMDRIRHLEREAARQERRVVVHLMVDTGMGRLGAQPARARELARAVAASPWLELEGIGSHVSSSRPGHDFTLLQRSRLAQLVDDLREEGIAPPLVHFANTASIMGGVGVELPLVRPGIALYGVVGPGPDAWARTLEPILSLRTQVVYLKDVPRDTPIGYNGTWVTPRSTRIATLPLGYNDGLAYRLSNRGRVLVRGAIAPIVGAVSMDYTMIDVGHIAGVRVGDVVTLIGRDGDETITVSELASLVGTIPYEIVCAVGKRVRRIYEPSAVPARAPAPSPAPARKRAARASGRAESRPAGRAESRAGDRAESRADGRTESRAEGRAESGAEGRPESEAAGS